MVFNENACKFAEQYLKKGSKIYVEGQLQTRKWQDQQGQEKYTTEVVVQNFNSQLLALDRPGGGGGSGGGDFGSDDSGSNFGSSGGRSAPARQPAMAGAGAGPREDMNDEIPF